ncbi:unnamed protein product, partial [Musa acuminata subsp. burmannicoides]
KDLDLCSFLSLSPAFPFLLVSPTPRLSTFFRKNRCGLVFDPSFSCEVGSVDSIDVVVDMGFAKRASFSPLMGGYGTLISCRLIHPHAWQTRVFARHMSE